MFQIAKQYFLPCFVAAALAGPLVSTAMGQARSLAKDAAQSEAVAGDARYRIGEGDVLQIMVWKEPEASIPSVVVRPDGRIAMPLLKEVQVAGLTEREAESLITQGLSKFMRVSDVTVVVSSMNKTVYLVGAVRKEGPIQLHRRLTMLQAISEAGGVTEFAKTRKIYLLRSVNGTQRRFAFNYDAVIRGQQMQQNIYVLPDDTIVVPH